MTLSLSKIYSRVARSFQLYDIGVGSLICFTCMALLIGYYAGSPTANPIAVLLAALGLMLLLHICALDAIRSAAAKRRTKREQRQAENESLATLLRERGLIPASATHVRIVAFVPEQAFAPPGFPGAGVDPSRN